MKTLERVVTVDVSTSRTSADDEELYDISRAYGLLLSASGLADSKSYRLKKVSEQVCLRNLSDVILYTHTVKIGISTMVHC